MDICFANLIDDPTWAEQVCSSRAHKALYLITLNYEVVYGMSRSKLEIYGDILKVLADQGPLKLTAIMYGANVNGNVLKEYLDFLLRQGLVDKQNVRKQQIFTVTQRGISILNYFKKMSIDLPIVEEPQTVLKYFKELSSDFR
jgi:predicted transcriptional regulator